MSEQRTILVVDDEPKLVAVVRDYLERDGYRVAVADDGREALERFQQVEPDLVVLDLMLPELDGLEVCRRLRQESGVPIIMLTARAEEIDETLGLELGADDYVTKPFSPRALLARVRAVLRRAGTGTEGDEAPLVRGPLRIDPSRHEATWAEVPLQLT
ncbi:MAG: response regulator transcription factor, partial [Chloroflexota bacterium]|nr:response regulator transcription factor [Chloroflexota bacterium]